MVSFCQILGFKPDRKQLRMILGNTISFFFLKWAWYVVIIPCCCSLKSYAWWLV